MGKKIIRLTRFCSQQEYNKFMAGEELVNDKDHFQGGKGGSTSAGFCFTPDEPKTAWRYLKGIVTADICMVLDIEATMINESAGVYADYSKGADFTKRCWKKEYCTKQYSNKTARLVKMLKPEEFATKDEVEAISMMKNLGLMQI